MEVGARRGGSRGPGPGLGGPGRAGSEPGALGRGRTVERGARSRGEEVGEGKDRVRAEPRFSHGRSHLVFKPTGRSLEHRRDAQGRQGYVEVQLLYENHRECRRGSGGLRLGLRGLVPPPRPRG